MQSEKEELHPTRKTFYGRDGMPFSGTISCVSESIEAWKAVCNRLECLEEGLSLKCSPHVLSNEGLVERSFGYTMKKGQGHQQNQKEYCESKRRVSMEFQIRMCKTSFNQYTKTKIRDKGYQHLHEKVGSELSVEILLDLFSRS